MDIPFKFGVNYSLPSPVLILSARVLCALRSARFSLSLSPVSRSQRGPHTPFSGAMDADFTFPARPTPISRPSPAQSPTEPANRQSNALRASVLDAALELGFGANGTVANWMFNNALEEQEEDEEDTVEKAPLSATSEEYGAYSTPPTSISSHSETFHPNLSPLVSPDTAVPVPQVRFPEIPAPVAVPAHANKLRKQRRDGGYESDGGYVSDGGKRTRTKSKTAKEAPPSMPVPPISEPMELIPLSKEERKRRKKAGKSSKDHGGAETDTEDVGKKQKSPPKPKKSKKPSTDGAAAGYETDDGYVSSSGKPKSKGRSRFFSLRRKQDSASEPAVVEPVPPMPEPREVFELPIASRFATTPEGGGSAAPSRSETPLLPPSRPFASSSSSPSSSSANSLLTPGDRDSFGNGSLSMNSDGGKGYNSTLSPASVSQDQLSSSRSVSPQPPTSNSNSKSKFAISFPLSRTASPNSQNSDSAKAKHVPSPITLAPPPSSSNSLNSRAPSPSPFGSPFVLLTPINTSPGGAPLRASSPSPSTATDNIVASTDFIVPSRTGSPLPPPSPNVLAYYDVPPPSPPPVGPLPRIPRAPPVSGSNREPALGVARLRSISQDRNGGGIGRSVSPSPTSTRAQGTLRPLSPTSASGAPSPISPGVQRGRAAPFPTQPLTSARAAGAGGAGGAGVGIGPGLAARAKVQRYRDLYAIQIPPTPPAARAAMSARPYDDDDEVDIRVEEWVDERGGEEEEADREMLGVLGRFRDTGAREQGRRMGIALERNNSGALRPGAGIVRRSPSPGARSPTVDEYVRANADRYAVGAYLDDDEASRYPDEEKTAGRSTMYRVDHSGRETMRWSEYSSRASFLDLDKSEKARGQLVDRVGAMFDLSGRERAAVPPVPKLPAGLLAGPGGNRF
ncbi:hypothetical protein B0H19DRAFT_1169507 [Mycena capillaripes]|nr:hypothetical protein B0H19DRAFT_1169507 [Mycena capillaripes]